MPHVKRIPSRMLHIVTLTAICAACPQAVASEPEWGQWGGPRADFIADSKGIASAWPETGPKQIWSRDLGDGYSAILVEGDRLYTMYRADDKERVVCLNASDGKTVWEHAYDSSPAEGHVDEFGRGPRSTPLIVGDRLYTIGVSGMMHCLDKNKGTSHWSHDLWGEFNGTKLPHGYSSSPIYHEGHVMALVGGEGSSIMAFNAKTGEIAWKKHDFKNSYATPKIYDIRGTTQLITFMAQEVVGLDPKTGELLWSFEHGNQWGQNICMPEWHEDILMISSPDAGARGLKLTQTGSAWSVDEVWSTRKIQFYHITAVRDGGWVYGSTGQRACFMASINVKTGKVGWRKRGFPKSNCIGVDGRLVILDEQGHMHLASATPEDLKVHSKFQLFDDTAWTVPTVVGKTLYARDKKKLVALNLG